MIQFMTISFESEGNTKTMGEIVVNLTEEFLELEFELLIKLTFNDIFRESPKVPDLNVIEYLLLCSWALQMVRARYHHLRMQVLMP